MQTKDNLSFKDLKPPLIIDFGTDTFKYCQPIINTSLMTKKMITLKNSINPKKEEEPQFLKAMESENKGKKEEKSDLYESINKLSANTIYDLNFTYKKKLTANKEFYKTEDNEMKFTYKDTIGVPDTINKYNFPLEPIYQGKINNEINYFNYFKDFKNEYEPYAIKINDRDEFFRDTPIIILQDCYPLKDLYGQVSKIYKFFFEEFESPYVLVQSKPSLDIFAHNLDTGIVVDFGDSKTSFTPVVNGFADYKNTKFNTFLSGRTITNFLNEIKYGGKNYIQAKYEKEKLCFLETNVGASIIKDHEHKNCFLNYLYVYPEIFKSHFRNSNFGGKPLKFHNYSFEDIKKIVLKDFSEGKEKKELAEKIDNFNKDMDSLYKNTSNESGFKFKDLETNFVNTKLLEFEQYSLAHLFLFNIAKLDAIKSPVITKEKIDVVLTGGVLNCIGMIKEIQGEINETDKMYKRFNFHYFEKFDHALGFSKGANYISNIDNIQNLMVSKRDYDEQGPDNLGYNYI